MPATFTHWLFRSWGGRTSIETIDVTGWDLSNTTDISGLFATSGLNGTNLKNIIGLDTWDLSNVTTLNDMFSGCTGLENHEFYVRTQADADRLNNRTVTGVPADRSFVVKPQE